MFADIDASNIVSLIGKPVWVFTETRKFNRNGRIYTASNVRNAIYKGSIQTIQIETVPVSQGPSKGWLPACFANVAVSIPDENGVSKYSLYLERQLLNVTVLKQKKKPNERWMFLLLSRMPVPALRCSCEIQRKTFPCSNNWRKNRLCGIQPPILALLSYNLTMRLS